MNAFSLVSKRAIFQKFRVQHVGTSYNLSLFVYAFYAFEFFLFYSYHNGDDDVMVIPFVIGTRQNDLLERALFILARLKALHSIISHFPSYLFSSIADDIQIINPPSIVSFAYEHFQIELCAIGFSIQL
jgi:hypothetical protein